MFDHLVRVVDINVSRTQAEVLVPGYWESPDHYAAFLKMCSHSLCVAFIHDPVILDLEPPELHATN